MIYPPTLPPGPDINTVSTINSTNCANGRSRQAADQRIAARAVGGSEPIPEVVQLQCSQVQQGYQQSRQPRCREKSGRSFTAQRVLLMPLSELGTFLPDADAAKSTSA